MHTDCKVCANGILYEEMKNIYKEFIRERDMLQTGFAFWAYTLLCAMSALGFKKRGWGSTLNSYNGEDQGWCQLLAFRRTYLHNPPLALPLEACKRGWQEKMLGPLFSQFCSGKIFIVNCKDSRLGHTHVYKNAQALFSSVPTYIGKLAECMEDFILIKIACAATFVSLIIRPVISFCCSTKNSKIC